VATDVIDFELAARVGVRIAPSGPPVDAALAKEVVEELRDLAAAAMEPVRHTSGLSAGEDTATTVVVDRAQWVHSNIVGFREVLTPLLDHMNERMPDASLAKELGSRATGVELGGVLGWLSGKVLGQYEAFVPPGVKPRLLLVAPNIVTAERALDVTPRDFRLWVCLHEETHRVQFGAVPWLADQLRSDVHTFLMARGSAVDLVKRAVALLEALVAVARGADTTALVAAVATPVQQAALDRITALMTLLEGHADHVMDEVGPDVVPSVVQIRDRFEKRRSSATGVDALARRLLGVDAKMKQYAEGAAFVRTVQDIAGLDGFNQVWSAPSNLPTRAEIAQPSTWVARVLS
jgi:coenzyme F420 biosynthesis associated uncharacterized protein